MRECSIFDGCENGSGIEFDENCKAGQCEDQDRIDVNQTFPHIEIGRTKSGETCLNLENCCVKEPSGSYRFDLGFVTTVSLVYIDMSGNGLDVQARVTADF